MCSLVECNHSWILNRTVGPLLCLLAAPSCVVGDARLVPQIARYKEENERARSARRKQETALSEVMRKRQEVSMVFYTKLLFLSRLASTWYFLRVGTLL